jgi:hypothetical protein
LIVVEKRESDQNCARVRIVPTDKRLFQNRGGLVVRASTAAAQISLPKDAS